MENLFAKVSEKLALLQEKLQEDQSPKWGMMNAQQMVEHLSLVFVFSTGKFGREFKGDPDKASQQKARFFSVDRPFPKGVRMPGREERAKPAAPRCESLAESSKMLQGSFDYFIKHYRDHPEDQVAHAYFGMLGYEEWLYFHHKHLEHHCMQFGLIPEPRE